MSERLPMLWDPEAGFDEDDDIDPQAAWAAELAEGGWTPDSWAAAELIRGQA